MEILTENSESIDLNKFYINIEDKSESEQSINSEGGALSSSSAPPPAGATGESSAAEAAEARESSAPAAANEAEPRESSAPPAAAEAVEPRESSAPPAAAEAVEPRESSAPPAAAEAAVQVVETKEQQAPAEAEAAVPPPVPPAAETAEEAIEEIDTYEFSDEDIIKIQNEKNSNLKKESKQEINSILNNFLTLYDLKTPQKNTKCFKISGDNISSTVISTGNITLSSKQSLDGGGSKNINKNDPDFNKIKSAENKDSMILRSVPERNEETRLKIKFKNSNELISLLKGSTTISDSNSINIAVSSSINIPESTA